MSRDDSPTVRGRVRDRIGDLSQRLAHRLGRAYDNCRSCDRPTRSHQVGGGVQCHRCYTDNQPVALTDGGSVTSASTNANIEDVVTVVDNLDSDAPVAMEIEDKLTEVTTADPQTAHELVSDALDLGVLEEDETRQGFGGIRLVDADADAYVSDADESTGKDVGFGDTNPRGETDKSLEERSLDAFTAAIEYFHSQLDRELPETYEGSPDTPREYYEEHRGWSKETIEFKQLGYAPADESALLDYLMQQGFDGDAIQGTGLFYEGFTPHFQGRYVLPYFDAEGDPVYAISRSLAEDLDGHPGDRYGNQKYTKALKTKDRTFVDEPIFGAETVDSDTERLLVAGGIADAISLHEAGYSCVSPVTTVRFKAKHEPRIVDMVERYDLDGVYMLNDAERPSVDETELPEGEHADSIGDCLTIMQYGEGLRASFGNAEFLHAEGIDTYLCDLPGGDDYVRKLDPDDYLKEGWGTVETLLRNATRAVHHDGFNQWSTSRSHAVEAAMQTGTGQYQGAGADTSQNGTGSDLGATTTTTTTTSASESRNDTRLYDLQYTDVSGLSLGDRQNNPFGHHGNSEGYFVCAEKNGFVHGYDHKYNVAYNALSHLLCDVGIRRADDPNGPLTDWEVFQAWQHAKSNGHLPDDDPVPYRALQAVAVEDGLVDREELVERDSDTGAVVSPAELANHDGDTYTALPSGTYNDVLQHIEDEYGVAPGRERAEGDALEPTTAVPLEMLASLDLDDARRFASKHDIEWATTREARARLRDEVFEVMTHGDTKVIDAPTALGKSYTVATEPWIRRESTTGGAPVIHTHETKEARDQAAAESADAGYEYAVLEGRTEACPVAAGEHDPLGREGTVDDFDREELPEIVITIDGTPASDFFDVACEDRGLPFSVAHKYLENHNDQDVDLPCCAGEGECPAVTQWDGLPRTESGEPAVDVIHCTHQFAHVPSLRNGTNLIFDERPDFREDLSHRQVREAISAYLSAADAPVTTFEEFVTGALDGDHTERVKQSLDYEPDREWYLEAEGAHTLARPLTRAVYHALKPEREGFAQDANGRYSARVGHEPPRLDADASDESGWNRTWVSVTLDENNTVRTVRNSPSLNGARSVIGLDAHPAQTQWELNVHPDIETSAVLDPAERAMWRRFERGLLTVGVGDATRPFTSGEYFDREGSEAFFAALREKFGEDFRTAITAASVESETRDILEDVGVEDPDTMHYGEEKSRNDFAGEDIGALNGCIDPGDDFVLDLLAERGLDATPERSDSDCEYCDGDGCHECNGTGKERAHGRGFVGPDAEAANELLASVREQHIAQGAGRLARNADDPEDRAIVFVRTDAAPPGFLDMQVPGVEWLATDTQTEIIETLSQHSSATTREIAESVGCSKEHARDTLGRLHDRGIVDVHENAGDHGAHLYRVLAGMDGPANTRPSEHVDLSPSVDDDADGDADETANDGVWEYSTWSLVVSSVTPSGSVMIEGSTPDAPADLSQSSDAAAVDTGEPPG